jgi:hypothetical protein
MATTACEYRHKARKSPERKALYLGIAKSIIAAGKKLKKPERKKPDPEEIIYCQGDE